MPYLPIDPADVGRTYDAVIRVNSQSGKGGVAYLLEREYGLSMPRLLQIEFSQVIQRIADATGKELSAAEIRAVFDREYVAVAEPLRYSTIARSTMPTTGGSSSSTARLDVDGAERMLEGAGNGPVDAFVSALRHAGGLDVHVQNYHEHSVGAGEDATAVSYVQLRIGDRSVGVRRRPRSQHRHRDAEGGGERRQSRDRAGLPGSARVRAAPRGRRRVARTRAPDRSGPSAGRAMRRFVASQGARRMR